MDTDEKIIRDALIEAHKAGQDGKDCPFTQWAERLANSLRQVPDGWVLVPREEQDALLAVVRESTYGSDLGREGRAKVALQNYTDGMANPAPPTSGDDCACIYYGLGKAPNICRKHKKATPAQALGEVIRHRSASDFAGPMVWHDIDDNEWSLSQREFMASCVNLAVQHGQHFAGLEYRIQTSEAFGEQCMKDIDDLLSRAEAAEARVREAEGLLRDASCAITSLSVLVDDEYGCGNKTEDEKAIDDRIAAFIAARENAT